MVFLFMAAFSPHRDRHYSLLPNTFFTRGVPKRVHEAFVVQFPNADVEAFRTAAWGLFPATRCGNAASYKVWSRGIQSD